MIFPRLTVEENLMLGAFSQSKMDRQTLAWVYELFPRLQERRKQLAGTLSGGEQQMLAISRALMLRPDLQSVESRIKAAGARVELAKRAWIPDPAQSHNYSTRVTSGGFNIAGFTSPALVLDPGQLGEVGADFYAGPKDQYRLKEISPYLDLSVDYGETTDVAAQHPEVVKDLIARHDAWWKECRPLMVNENVAGPAENPFKVMYREQTGK